MRRPRRTALLLALAGMLGAARADIIFSDVTVSGSLATGASFASGASDIDFILPDALVGDPVDPRRQGDLLISYRAESDAGTPLDFATVGLLGALSGSGTITLAETVEDLDQPGLIASYEVVLDDNWQLPHKARLSFARLARRVRVGKTLVLEAPDSLAFDLAEVSLVEQALHAVPEPAGAALLGVLALRRRRR